MKKKREPHEELREEMTFQEMLEALPWIDPGHHTPARTIGRSATSFVGQAWSNKGQRHIQHESLQEKKMIQLLEMAPSVWRYLEQPKSISYRDENGRDCHFTPDLLAIFRAPRLLTWRTPPVLIEVKPICNLTKWYEENRLKVSAARSFARRTGMEFRIVTDVEVHERRSEVLHWIESHGPIQIEDHLRLPALKMISEWPKITLVELLHKMELRGFDPMDVARSVCGLLREGYLATQHGLGNIQDMVLSARVKPDPFTLWGH